MEELPLIRTISHLSQGLPGLASAAFVVKLNQDASQDSIWVDKRTNDSSET